MPAHFEIGTLSHIHRIIVSTLGLSIIALAAFLTAVQLQMLM